MQRGFVPLFIIICLALVTAVAGSFFYLESRQELLKKTLISDENIKSPTTPNPTIAPLGPWVCDASLYKCNVLDLINLERTAQNLKKIEADQDLCKLAIIYAEDSEKAYPGKINKSLLKYTTFLKNYPIYHIDEVSLLDGLVEYSKKTGMPLIGSDESILKSFTKYIGNEVPADMDPNITNGCVAASSGNLGYKPFVFFVSGVKK